MKNLFIITILLLSLQANAQLTDTKWTGEFRVPDKIVCILSFKSDTMYVLLKNQPEPIEVSTYSIAGDTLFIKKVKGGSPCDTSITGSYSFKIDAGKLSVKVIDDSCFERTMAFPEDALDKVEDNN